MDVTRARLSPVSAASPLVLAPAPAPAGAADADRTRAPVRGAAGCGLGLDLDDERTLTPRRFGNVAEAAMPWDKTTASHGFATQGPAPAGVPWGLGRAPGRTAAFVSLASDPNVCFRPYMEDGQHVADPLLLRGAPGSEDAWGFFAVYDGHGGRHEVDYCESKLHELVMDELRREASEHLDVGRVLVESFRKVDAQLAMLGAWKSGCCATVALLHRRGAAATLHVANVGDSRAVLVGPGLAKRVSRDHRASDPEEAKRIAADGGFVRHGRVAGSLSVSRSLGDHHLKECGVSCVPDVCSCTLEAGEASGGLALVIASDGLWDALEDDDARQVVRDCVAAAETRGCGPEGTAAELRGSAARSLVEVAKERGSRDNILALVVFF